MDAPADFTTDPHFQRILALVPKRMREDALQEAWVAHLSGESPTRALQNYQQRERRHEKRQPGRITPQGDAFTDEAGQQHDI
jgi:hypothetical protein